VSEVWTVTARHGSHLSRDDREALAVVRRTLLGLASHGFIADVETFAGPELTEWSYRPATEDAAGVAQGVLDLLEVIAPGWPVEVRSRPVAADPS
jgi:hypothetical protein